MGAYLCWQDCRILYLCQYEILEICDFGFCLFTAFAVQARTGVIRQQAVIDRLSRKPVAYAAVVLAGGKQKALRRTRPRRFHASAREAGHLAVGGFVGGLQNTPTPEYMSVGATFRRRSRWRRTPRSWKP